MTTTTPFIEGTQVQWAWDSTSLGWLKECPRKYYYHMVCGYIGRGESVHLRFGILYHHALEEYDRQRTYGASHEEALHKIVRDTLLATWENGKPWRASRDLSTDDRASLKCRENLIRTIVWYLDKFKDDPAKTLVSSADGRPMVELNFKFSIGLPVCGLPQPYALCGYLDRVVSFQDQSFVMDRKTTTSTVGSNYFDQYDPDNQMSFYTVASQVAFHTPVKGVIVDAAQIAVGFSRFVRSFIFKTGDQIAEWMKDLDIWLRQAEIYAEKGYWPMNDRSCHKFGGCIFRGICSKSPSVRDRFLESNFEKKQWNPLIPR